MEIVNKKARFDYFTESELEAGIVLTGTEIKSIRQGSANLKDAYGIVKDNELYLLNMYIAKYTEGNRFNHEERKTRKLLVHKREIKKISCFLKEEGYSLIPLKLYFKKNKVKLLMGICRGKHLYDKRQTIKERDLKREEKNAT